MKIIWHLVSLAPIACVASRDEITDVIAATTAHWDIMIDGAMTSASGQSNAAIEAVWISLPHCNDVVANDALLAAELFCLLICGVRNIMCAADFGFCVCPAIAVPCFTMLGMKFPPVFIAISEWLVSSRSLIVTSLARHVFGNALGDMTMNTWFAGEVAWEVKMHSLRTCYDLPSQGSLLRRFLRLERRCACQHVAARLLAN
jgi:hypothetical protein